MNQNVLAGQMERRLRQWDATPPAVHQQLDTLQQWQQDARIVPDAVKALSIAAEFVMAPLETGIGVTVKSRRPERLPGVSEFLDTQRAIIQVKDYLDRMRRVNKNNIRQAFVGLRGIERSSYFRNPQNKNAARALDFAITAVADANHLLGTDRRLAPQKIQAASDYLSEVLREMKLPTYRAYVLKAIEALRGA